MVLHQDRHTNLFIRLVHQDPAYSYTTTVLVDLQSPYMLVLTDFARDRLEGEWQYYLDPDVL